MKTPYKYIENWLILGLFLLPPLMIGYWAGKNEIIQKSGVVTIDILKYEDEILVYEHYKGELLFEYNRKQEEYNLFSNLIEKLD